MAQKKGNIEGEDVNLPPNLSYTYVFLGLEYTSEEKCTDQNSDYAQLLAKDIISSPTPQKLGQCDDEILNILQGNKPSLKSCIEKMNYTAIIDESEEYSSELQKDALRKALSFDSLDGSNITTETEREAYKIILGDFLGAIITSYWNYGEACEVPDTYGWQDLQKFNEYTHNDLYQSVGDDDDYLNSFVGEICRRILPKDRMECKDLAPLMQELTPEELNITYDPKKIKMTKNSSPNNFRCLID